jgi:hypothetical protein
MRQEQDEEYDRAFMLGFAHSLHSLSYRDGTSPQHRLTVVVPGCAFKNPTKCGYRDGWHAAMGVPPLSDLRVGSPTPGWAGAAR